MAFPNKKYFSLNEVSARWSRKIKDVEYCVENGLLDAYVKVCCVSLGDSSNPSLPQYEFTGCMHLLLTANYEDKRWRNIDVKRGQIITGRMELAQTLRLSERQIRTALDKLKMSGVITIKTTNQYSLITVENYSCFQNLSAENDQPKAKQPTNQKSAESPSNSQQRVRPVSTTQEDKNLKTKISSLHSDILSKSSQKPVTSKKMSFADLLKSKGIA